MTTTAQLVGILDDASVDPAGTVRSFLPRRKHERPPAKYGKRGIYVVMQPITGLTPAGVFFQNKPFAFQVPPMDQFGEDGSFNWQDYDTTQAGQHSQRLGRQLRTVQFQTMFLTWEPEWALAHDGSGSYPWLKAKEDLCAIRDHGHPFHLLAHLADDDSKFLVDYAATLRSVSWYIAEPDAVYVTVQFTEFSTPDIQEFLAGSNAHPHLPASLKVASLPANRNTLSKMAKFYYGDPAKWKQIAAKNGLTHVPANGLLTGKNVRATRITVPVMKTAKPPTKQHR